MNPVGRAVPPRLSSREIVEQAHAFLRVAGSERLYALVSWTEWSAEGGGGILFIQPTQDHTGPANDLVIALLSGHFSATSTTKLEARAAAGTRWVYTRGLGVYDANRESGSARR
jgi:hypothetical protein